MRRILVENARRKRRLKHGGQRHRVSVADVADEDADSRLLALDDALMLAAEDRQAAQVVQLHRFGGLSHQLVAQSLGLTVYRVRQKWTYSQAWLRDDMKR
jgi:DNA-directed RNA polymerase specialized sigma24 family protein